MVSTLSFRSLRWTAMRPSIHLNRASLRLRSARSTTSPEGTMRNVPSPIGSAPWSPLLAVSKCPRSIVVPLGPDVKSYPAKCSRGPVSVPCKVRRTPRPFIHSRSSSAVSLAGSSVNRPGAALEGRSSSAVWARRGDGSGGKRGLGLGHGTRKEPPCALACRHGANRPIVAHSPKNPGTWRTCAARNRVNCLRKAAIWHTVRADECRDRRRAPRRPGDRARQSRPQAPGGLPEGPEQAHPEGLPTGSRFAGGLRRCLVR